RIGGTLRAPMRRRADTAGVRRARRWGTMAKLIEPIPAETEQSSATEPERAEAAGGAPALPVPLVLRMTGAARMDAAQFFEFCQQNDFYRIERAASGEVIIMPPTEPPTSQRNGELVAQLCIWVKQDGTGVPYES